MPKKKQIMLCVPAADGMVTTWIAQFMAFLKDVTYHPQSHWVFDTQFLINCRPVHYARNRIVGEFLKTDNDYLWMIDADLNPDSSVVSMLDVDADIVCGRALYWSGGDPEKSKAPALLIAAHKEVFRNEHREWENVTDAGRTNPVEDVDACGTGCILIKRRVLEDPRMLLTGEAVDPDGLPFTMHPSAPPYFRMYYAPNGQLMRGEDLDFTQRAKKLGYTIKYNAVARLGHVKPIDMLEIEHAILAKMKEAVDHANSRADAEHQNV